MVLQGQTVVAIKSNSQTLLKTQFVHFTREGVKSGWRKGGLSFEGYLTAHY